MDRKLEIMITRWTRKQKKEPNRDLKKLIKAVFQSRLLSDCIYIRIVIYKITKK